MGTIDCIHCVVVSHSMAGYVAIAACEWIAYVRQPHEMIKSTQKWYRSRQLAFVERIRADTMVQSIRMADGEEKTKTNHRRFAGSTEMILYLLHSVSEA